MSNDETLPPVLVEVSNGVAVLRLNRPPLNPFDTPMRDSLDTAVGRIAADRAVKACVIHGGEEHFAAGADIEALAAMDYTQIVDWNARLQHAFTSVAALPFPVIAAVNGYALGGGLELALAADIRIGSQTCVVGLPEVTLGIIPGSGGTQRLTQIVGRSRAKRMIFTGRHVDAGEAVEMGIIDWSVDPNSTISAALEVAGQLAAAPQQAIRAAKEAIDAALPVHSTGLALERSLLAGTFATPDRAEAMANFLVQRAERGPRRGERDDNN